MTNDTSTGSSGPGGFHLPDVPALLHVEHDMRRAADDVARLADSLSGLARDPALRPALHRLQAAIAMLRRLQGHGLESTLARVDPVAADGPFDLGAFCTDLVARWHDPAAGVEIRVETVAPPLAIPADRVALERLIANLIWIARGPADSRAGAGGGVLCRLWMDSADPALLISVVDGGTHSAPSPWAGEAADLGIEVVRQMATRLGGRLSLSSTASGRSEVVFSLPLPGPAAAPATAAGGEPSPELSGLRLLVACGAPATLRAMDLLLSGTGAAVVTATDGADLRQQLLAQPFDALVATADLGSLSGTALLALLDESPLPGPRPAAVLLVTSTGRAERDRLRAAGAEAVLVMPVLCPFAMGEAVLGALARRAARAGAPAPAPSQALPDEGPLLRLLTMAGPVAAAELLLRLLDDLKAAENDMLAAAVVLDHPALMAATHVLVSVAGAVGATALQHEAERLNRAASARDAATIKELVGRAAARLDGLIQQIADLQAARAGKGAA